MTKFFERKDRSVIPYEWKEGAAKFKDSMKENYATDFLIDRGVEFIEKHAQRKKPFAIMISIPDPYVPFSLFSTFYTVSACFMLLSNVLCFCIFLVEVIHPIL